MHKRVFLIALVAVVAGLIALSLVEAEATVFDHPPKCYGCHSYIDNLNNMTRVGPHNVTLASEAWSLCFQCHSTTGSLSGFTQGVSGTPPYVGDYVAASVHQDIGCKCHAVLHVGNTTPYGGWLYYYLPNVTELGNISKPPSNVALIRYARFFYQGVNDTKLDPNGFNGIISNYTNSPTGVYIVFFDTQGNVLDLQDRYLICFNCHFLTSQPAGLGMYKIENGLLKIGIPPEALQLEPHGITEEQLRSILSGGREALPTETVPLAAMGINALLAASILLILVRRRS